LEFNEMKKTLTALILYFLTPGILTAGISLDPGITELTVKPGTPYEGSITVGNSTDYHLDIKVEPENWLKRRGFENHLSEMDPEEWISIPSSFSINAGEEKEIQYTLNIPQDERIQGQLVAMIFFSPQTESEGISVQNRFGASIYSAIKGTENISSEITSERASSERFTVRVKNSGNVHIRPQGYVIIYDLFTDEETRRFPLRAGNPIFPGRSHSFSAPFGEDLPNGRYIAQAVVEYGMIYGEKRTIKSEAVEFRK